MLDHAPYTLTVTLRLGDKLRQERHNHKSLLEAIAAMTIWQGKPMVTRCEISVRLYEWNHLDRRNVS